MLMSYFEGVPLPAAPNVIPTTLITRASTVPAAAETDVP